MRRKDISTQTIDDRITQKYAKEKQFEDFILTRDGAEIRIK